MDTYTADTLDYSGISDVVISLPGYLPENGTCLHVPYRALSGSMSFTVKVAKALHVLRCNWEKIKFNCSVSLKKAKETVCRISRFISTAAPMKPAAVLTASCVRLRL